jgi:membrane-associated phospholipid phosphatase
VIVGGIALPMLRRRLRLRPAAVLTGAALAPLSAAVVWPRTRGRDIAICALQMYVYVAAYKMPHDEPEMLEARVRIDYPITLDRALGAGDLPTTRLQRALHSDGTFSTLEKTLVWAHWVWFATPHAALLYVRAHDRSRFARAAVLTYAVFDAGVITYWLVPTAPPWYAAQRGRLGECAEGEATRVRRLMVEYGESFWQDSWAPLYSVLGGNPLAAMPSLHFATSSMAALLLSETGFLPGVIGTSYAAVLGFALVYLGEHYVVDLVGGLALCALVRASEPLARGPLARLASLVGAARRLALEPGSI